MPSDKPLRKKKRNSIIGNSEAIKEELKYRNNTNVTHGAFTCAKGGYPAQYIYIPKKQKLSADLVERIMKHWDRPYPSLMLRLKSGYAHPENLLCDDDVELFKSRVPLNYDGATNWMEELLHDFMEDADDRSEPLVGGGRKSNRKQEGVQNHGVCFQKSSTKKLNAILHRQLITMVRMIVNVAAMNDVWIVVQGRPTGIAVVLEQVLHDTEPKPVVLVVDSPQAEKYTNVEKNLQQYNKLFEQLTADNPMLQQNRADMIRHEFGKFLVDKELLHNVMTKIEASKREKVCECGNVFMDDALFCRHCGKARHNDLNGKWTVVWEHGKICIDVNDGKFDFFDISYEITSSVPLRFTGKDDTVLTAVKIREDEIVWTTTKPDRKSLQWLKVKSPRRKVLAHALTAPQTTLESAHRHSVSLPIEDVERQPASSLVESIQEQAQQRASDEVMDWVPGGFLDTSSRNIARSTSRSSEHGPYADSVHDASGAEDASFYSGLDDRRFWEKTKQATHRFEPGEMGLDYDNNGIVVGVRDDGQVDVKGMGIKSGNRILKVRLHKEEHIKVFSKAAVRGAEQSGKVYEVTFQVGQDRGSPGIDVYSLKREREDQLKDYYVDAITHTLREAIDLCKQMTDTILENRRPLDEPAGDPVELNNGFWTGTSWKKSTWFQQSAKKADTWDVRVPQYMFRGGTHYLLFEDESVGSSSATLNNFGPKGSLFVGGGQTTVDDVIEGLRDGDPTVLFDNTGRVTQLVAAFHHELLGHFMGRKNPICKRSEEKIPDWIGEFFRHFKKGKDLNLEDIVEIFHLYRHRYSILSLTCKCLDPLDVTLNERDVLGQISECFGSSRCVSTNLAGENANHHAVATAWQMHSQLYQTCSSNKKKADLCSTSLLIVSLVSLFASLILLLHKSNDLKRYVGHWDKDSIIDLLDVLVIVLPACSGLINTVSSRMKYSTKWGLMKRAAALIECEIFKFRTRVQDYAVVSGGQGGAHGQVFANRKAREQHVRHHFVSKVQDTFQTHLAEIGEASLLQVLECDSTTALRAEIESYARAAQFLTICQFGNGPGKLISKNSWSKTAIETQSSQRDTLVTKHKAKAAHARQIGKALDVGTEPDDPQRETSSSKIRFSSFKLPTDVFKSDAKIEEDDEMKTRFSVIKRAQNTENKQPKRYNTAAEFGFLSSDEYFKTRMLPALHTMTADASTLQGKISLYEILIGICAAFSTIAGALNEPILVCGLVSITVCLSSHIKEQAYGNRLVTTNAAVRMLTKLNMSWTSANPIHQAKVAVVTEMVEETEQVRLSVINAWTGGINAGQTSKGRAKQDDGTGHDSGNGRGRAGGSDQNAPESNSSGSNGKSSSAQ